MMSFKFQVSSFKLLAILAAAAVFGVAIACAITRAGVPQQSFDHAGYAKTWQDLYESTEKENALIDELNADVKANPPGRVRSARRIEIWDELITEHERQIKDFRKLRDAER